MRSISYIIFEFCIAIRDARICHARNSLRRNGLRHQACLNSLMPSDASILNCLVMSHGVQTQDVMLWMHLPYPGDTYLVTVSLRSALLAECWRKWKWQGEMLLMAPLWPTRALIRKITEMTVAQPVLRSPHHVPEATSRWCFSPKRASALRKFYKKPICQETDLPLMCCARNSNWRRYTCYCMLCA